MNLNYTERHFEDLNITPIPHYNITNNFLSNSSPNLNMSIPNLANTSNTNSINNSNNFQNPSHASALPNAILLPQIQAQNFLQNHNCLQKNEYKKFFGIRNNEISSPLTILCYQILHYLLNSFSIAYENLKENIDKSKSIIIDAINELFPITNYKALNLALENTFNNLIKVLSKPTPHWFENKTRDSILYRSNSFEINANFFQYDQNSQEYLMKFKNGVEKSIEAEELKKFKKSSKKNQLFTVLEWMNVDKKGISFDSSNEEKESIKKRKRLKEDTNTIEEVEVVTKVNDKNILSDLQSIFILPENQLYKSSSKIPEKYLKLIVSQILRTERSDQFKKIKKSIN
jgi:hypothetical protein